MRKLEINKKKLRFSKCFFHQMSIIAIVTGIIISVCMPVIFLAIEWREAEIRAYKHTVDIKMRMGDLVEKEPGLLEYHTNRIGRIFSNSLNTDGISEIRIYNKKHTLIYQKQFEKPFFINIKNRVEILKGDTCYGFIEVIEKTSDQIFSIGLLFAFSTIAGIIMLIVLYKFPAKMVHNAQTQIEQAFVNLEDKNAELEKLKADLEEKVIRDSKTRLYNGAYAFERLNEEIQRVDESGGSVVVMMMDIDYFKNYNDSLGHIKGDEALMGVAEVMRSNVRETDIVGRYGGEEFILVFSDIGDEQIYNIGERLRLAVEKREFYGEENQPGQKLTISIGISSYRGGPITVQQLIEEADQALYKAKEAGRNKVCLDV